MSQPWNEKPPRCAYCGVNPVKWCPRLNNWRTYCDRSCAGCAVSEKRSPAVKAQTAERFLSYVRARRGKRVRGDVEAWIGGRALVPASEVLELVIRFELQGYRRGYAAAWMAHRPQRHEQIA